MGGDRKLRSSVAGRDADGRSDGTRTGLMNGAQGVKKSEYFADVIYGYSLIVW